MMMKCRHTCGLIIFLLACQSAFAQNQSKIQGTVSDFLTGKRIAQTNISVKGLASTSTETSADGTFTMDVPSLYAVLLISYPGYQTKEFPLYGNDQVSIHLVPEGIDIGESTVRLPYYT